MGNFIEFLRNLGTMRLAIMGGVFIALVLFFVFMMTRLTGSSMELLFSNLEPTDSKEVISQLQKLNIPYETRNKGNEIYVAGDKVGSTRIALASEGLPGGGSVGYEIFDDSSSLGTTNFMQNLSLVRALEGELARTIRSLKSVYSARVHLVLPKRQLFSREKQPATASVIIKMKGSGKLAGDKIAAIQHLVASAVPELEPSRVAIVDDKGNLLATGNDADAIQANSILERKINLETRLTRELTELLTKSVGPGKVHVRVDAELDFDRVSTTEETFDPDGQVVRSTRVIDESQTSEESQSPPVTVENNVPDGTDQGGPKSSSREAKTDEQVNFEVSKKITNFVRETGALKRLSVAVLVDGVITENPNGTKEYRPRQAPEMANLTKLVSSAIGFDRSRGDTVEVINMRFADQRLDTGESKDLLFGMEKSDLTRIAEIIVLSILAILVILLIIRPLLSRAFDTLPLSAAAAEQKMLEDAAMSTPALTGPDGITPQALEDFDDLIDIESMDSRVKASALKQISDIIENEPEQALSIIRSWMYAET
ncbi:flagellar basal-body MS-ring/collar protein FliF [Rhodospirillales bacterium]|nr:flagellar basal-body MS-ring/collar protein FliF [Rhodospirillales bacterium]